MARQKSTYFASVIGDIDPITPREMTVRGKTVTTYWKQLTAGQRVQMLRGQRVQTHGDQTTMTIELGESEERNHQLVVWTLVDEKGTNVYSDVHELQSEPNWFVAALVKEARAVAAINSEEEDAGKS